MKICPQFEHLFDIEGRNAPRRGESGPQRVSVPVLQYKVKDWPAVDELEALLFMADLQYVDRVDLPIANHCLLGEVVAQELAEFAGLGLVPPTSRAGVILGGDLYTCRDLADRGATGDVDEVWIAFANHFRWVTGVAGNHDLFRGRDSFSGAVHRTPNCHPLKADVVDLDGLRIAGFSGIPGNPRKPWRYTVKEADEAVPELLVREPDLLVLHAGPAAPGFRGCHHMAELLEFAPPPLVVMGHCHWRQALVQGQESQLLNVDSRIVYLTRAV